MNKTKIAQWDDLEDRKPAHALVANVDLVLVRHDDAISVLYGRCLHRGALLADGSIRGNDIVCGVHDWDYQFDSGISAYNPEERLHKFGAWVEDGAVWVDEDEIAAWESDNPQPYRRDTYQGTFQDHSKGSPAEPHVKFIRELASHGLDRVGHHGPVKAMGVPKTSLPAWDDLQFVTAQLARVPQLDDTPVGTELVIGPNAAQPLKLDIPIFVSDMSFGALSLEAKVALAKGAELAGTGISRPVSASRWTSSRRSRPSTSRAAREPRRAPAATSPVRRSRAR
jgi:nitrite reductase/ring-hydroxylating ferredoxin subunit